LRGEPGIPGARLAPQPPYLPPHGLKGRGEGDKEEWDHPLDPNDMMTEKPCEARDTTGLKPESLD